MRVVARSTLVSFYRAHPETEASLTRWYELTKKASWKSMSDIQAAFPKAKVLNGQRVRFEIAGGNYRLIVAFDFPRKVAFVKFVGTHAQYDSVNVYTISQF